MRAKLRLMEVWRQTHAAPKGPQRMDAIDAGERRKLGQRNVVGEMRREVVECQPNGSWVTRARSAMRHRVSRRLPIKSIRNRSRGMLRPPRSPTGEHQVQPQRLPRMEVE